MTDFDLPPTVIYDGECPFCSSYVSYYRLKQSLGELRLVDARSLTADEAAALGGHDLDEGMLFVLNGQTYHGADAVHMLALMTSGSGLFNKLNAAVFRSRWLSKILYPGLRLGRIIALKIRGSTMIRDTFNK